MEHYYAELVGVAAAAASLYAAQSKTIIPLRAAVIAANFLAMIYFLMHEIYPTFVLNAIMLPMYVLSGVFFSAARFPEATQPIIQALPLTALNDGLRAVMNDGAGWEALPYPLLVLGIWGVGCFALALKIFRWR